ncbi:hypothetical protein [Streptomyces sp. NPDC058108]|uniref:hypothetical protein n=1 Tax=Streptomyces sp. NPDC058108 TaxID=3346344 RepID=UPI0036F0848D
MVMVGCGLRKVLERHGAVIDDRMCLRCNCSVHAVEQVVGAASVAVADVETSEVDQGFQGMSGLLRVQGLCAQEDFGVTPAESACQVWDAAVACDQCCFVDGDGC